MKSILVAVDGSSHADKAASLATDLAVKFGADLGIVHVLDNSRLTPEAKHMAKAEFAED
jgi:nucleotide-binding universal stress UspA family protein